MVELTSTDGEVVVTRIFTQTLQVQASTAPAFVDITEQVEQVVARAGIQHGLAIVFSRHTTAGIRINENEPELLDDLARFLGRLAPAGAYYRHNDFDVRTHNVEAEECPNGHAHCQHFLVEASEAVPVLGGKLQLGRWQRIFLVELDRPRPREVIIQVFGA
ncbi:MAG: secondary thiamine-phosphate synthase enzyme [Chloroflexota bacterium]|mgnify:CR=1 FL=1